MKTYLLLLLLVLYCPLLYAGFPVGKGRTVFSISYSYFFSDHFFDNNGALKKSDNNFSSHFASIYIAHGVSRKLDLFASLPYTFEYSIKDSVLYRHGLADMEFGLSLSFPNKLYNKFTGLKIAGIIPLSHGQTPIPISYDEQGVEVSVNYFRARQSLIHRGFFSVEGTYRHYFSSNGADQFLFNIQRFVSLTKYLYFDYGMFGIYSVSLDKTNKSATNSSKDFYNIQVKLSLCRKIRRNLTLYLEGYVIPVGRNTGFGVGGSTFAVLRIP